MHEPSVCLQTANQPLTDIAGSSRLHLKFVDGLRGLLAVYVVLTHAWLQTWPGNIYGAAYTPTGWTRVLTAWLDHGTDAVTFFIAISGFCLMLPVLGNDGNMGPGGVNRFFLRRVRRILPPYYAALILSIMLVSFLISSRTHSLYDASLPMTKAGILSHLVLLHNLNTATNHQISAPLWSVAVECQIYLFFPLLAAIRRSFGMIFVVGIAYILSIFAESEVAGTAYQGLSPIYLFIFVLGMYAAELSCRPRNRHFIWIGCAAAVLTIVMTMTPFLAVLVIRQVVYGVFIMCLLISCAHWPSNPIARCASYSPVAMVGTFSYSLYLVHFPVQQVLWEYLVLPLKLGPVKTFSVMATAGTTVILALSYAFYCLFERPFCNQRSVRRPHLSQDESISEGYV